MRLTPNSQSYENTEEPLFHERRKKENTEGKKIPEKGEVPKPKIPSKICTMLGLHFIQGPHFHFSFTNGSFCVWAVCHYLAGSSHEAVSLT